VRMRAIGHRQRCRGEAPYRRADAEACWQHRNADLSGGGVTASLPASQRSRRALSFDAVPAARALQLMALREVTGARRRESGVSITLASARAGVRETHQSVTKAYTMFFRHAPVAFTEGALVTPRSPFDSGNGTGCDLPDVLCILRDSPVAGEPAGAGDVQDRLVRPAWSIRVESPHSFLCLGI